MALQEQLTFIADRESADDDRIERIKDLLIDSDSLTTDDRMQIGGVLAAIIEQDDEDLVLRQHAATEIGYYWKEPSPSLRKRYEDPNEDEDLRYNLQASFEVELPIEILRPTKPEQY